MIRCLLAFILTAMPLQADPVLSLAGTLPASGEYGAVLETIDAIDASATSLTLYWDDLERDGAYAADPDWPAIAAEVYPARQIAIHLTIAVIDTTTDRRPDDLQAVDWDDPTVTARFDAMAAEVFHRLEGTTLLSVAIGNEVDGHLSGDAWNTYGRFFAHARDTVRSLSDAPVTVTTTWGGLSRMPEARALAERGDGLSITYYPVDDAFHFAAPEIIERDLAAMAELAGTRPWDLAEVGYASGGCGLSSLTTQARFFETLLDRSQDLSGLRLIQLVWSHDISRDAVRDYAAYYGVTNACFADYLGSLGLKTADDQPKPVFEMLRKRGR